MDHLTLLSFLVIIMIVQDLDVQCIVALIVYSLTELVIITRCNRIQDTCHCYHHHSGVATCDML